MPPARESQVRIDGRILGRYRLLTHIANGGMASVHVARAEGTLGFERLVAVKLLHPHLASEEEFVTMIIDEARMAARIRHPKVVSVLDVDEDPELGLYLVMDYVEGDHLGNVISGLRTFGETMPPRVAVRIVLDLLEGLAAAHELVDGNGRKTPIVHRDVSPHNVLLGVDGMARLADFGVARAEARLTHTQEGRFKGKIAYMAPEQLADGVADARSDVFAAGIVLWETLTGLRLFRAESTAQTLKKLLHDPIPRVDAIDPSLAPLADVVARALARDPNDRFASASEMGLALASAAGGSLGLAEPREVTDVVRASRGSMLAERTARIRESAATFVSPIEPTVSRRRPPLAVERTNPQIPSRKAAARSLEDDEEPRRSLRWIAPLALALVGVAAAALVGWTRLDGRARVRTLVAARDAATALLPSDGEAALLQGTEPAIAADLATVTPTIVVRVRVGADGIVREATPFQPRRELAELERHAVATVRGYVFRPAYRGGRAVESYLNLPIHFRRMRGPDHVVRIKGSDTIGGALAPALALAYRTLHPDVHVVVEALGSSTAFVGLFDGSADLGASSRPIEASESDEAGRLGIALEETVVGYDGIAVIVHPENPIRVLSLEQLAGLFGGSLREFEAIGVGGSGHVRALGRPSYSGTHRFFEDRVLEPQGLRFGAGVESIERSEDLVRAVSSDPGAIAYVGAASVDGTVRVVAIADGERDPVAPSEASIRDGSYPIFRPLLMYSRGTPTGAAAGFLRFVLSPQGHEVVRAHGFVPSEATLGANENTAGSSAPTLVRRITFPERTTRVPSSAEASLDEIAAHLRAHPGAHVLVSGHADAEGTEDENVRVGRDRARSVTDALVRLGVDRARIASESRGSTAPIATNRDEAGRERNRRVDVLVVDAAP